MFVAAGPTVLPFLRLCGVGPGGSMPFYDIHSCFFLLSIFSFMSRGVDSSSSSVGIVAPSTPSLPHRSVPQEAPVGVLPAPPSMGVVDGSLANKPSELSEWRGAAPLSGLRGLGAMACWWYCVGAHLPCPLDLTRSLSSFRIAAESGCWTHRRWSPPFAGSKPRRRRFIRR